MDSHEIDEVTQLRQQLAAEKAEKYKWVELCGKQHDRLCEFEQLAGKLATAQARVTELEAAMETAASMAGERWLEAQLLLSDTLHAQKEAQP